MSDRQNGMFVGTPSMEADIARCESLVFSAAKMLKKYPNPQTKLRIMWELAYVQLRNLEDWRKP